MKFSTILSIAGSLVGGALGGPVGGFIGGTAGNALGGAIDGGSGHRQPRENSFGSANLGMIANRLLNNGGQPTPAGFASPYVKSTLPGQQ